MIVSQTTAESLWQWWVDAWPNLLGFAICIVVGAVGMAAVGLIWRRVLIPLTLRTKTQLDDLVLTPVRRPLQFLVLVAAISFGSEAWLATLPGVKAHAGWSVFQGALYVMAVAAVAVGIHGMARALVDWYFARFDIAPGKAAGHLASIIRTVTKVLIFFIALTVIFEHFQVQITALLATAGIASLAVALAAQETMANLIAGLALLIDHPFKAGDRIQLSNGQLGDVIEIGLRSTRVLSFDNTVITIPNSEIAKAQIINLNAPTAHVKIRCTIGVAYNSDVRKAKAILLDIMTAHPDVQKTPAPAVYFTEFAEAALNLLIECWVADYRDKSRVLDELNLAIKDRFEADRVSFPQRDLFVRMVPLAPPLEKPPCSEPR